MFVCVRLPVLRGHNAIWISEPGERDWGASIARLNLRRAMDFECPKQMQLELSWAQQVVFVCSALTSLPRTTLINGSSTATVRQQQIVQSPARRLFSIGLANGGQAYKEANNNKLY